MGIRGVEGPLYRGECNRPESAGQLDRERRFEEGVMRFLKRGSAPSTEAGVTAFWSWWPSAKDRYATAIADGTLPRLAEEVTRRVKGIHPGLAWEFSPGRAAKHALVVTPEGNPELRPAALDWLAAAPPADETWEYHASRQPGTLGVLDIGGHQLRLDEMRVATTWDENRQMLHVSPWHPAFASLPEKVRLQVAFLFIDNLLGEEAAERWIGRLSPTTDAQGGLTAEELQREIGYRAATASAESWIVAERTDARGERAIVRVNAALKRIDHPYAMHDLVVTIQRGLEQLAGSPELQQLDDAQEELVTDLQDIAVSAGQVTERRRRRAHFVTAHADQALEVARAWAVRHAGFGITAEVVRDPEWRFRAELLG
jgi:hypothetical protein